MMMRSTAATVPVSRRRTSRSSLDPVFRSSPPLSMMQQKKKKKKKIPVAHHTLLLLPATPYASGQFLCHVCWERGSGAHFHCPDCQLDLHVTCCASSATASQDLQQQMLDDPLVTNTVETHFSHAAHPLLPIRRSVAAPLSIITCDGCGDALTSSSPSVDDDNITYTHVMSTSLHDDTFYRCSRCDFDLCPLCTRAPRFLLHPSHPHALVLTRTHPATDGGGDLEGDAEELMESARRRMSSRNSGRSGGNCTSCDGCGEMTTHMHGGGHGGELEELEEEEEEEEEERRGGGGCWMMYRCVACDFDVHEACVRLPLKPLLSHIHPDHPLTLLFGRAAAAAAPPNQPCDACGQHIFAGHSASGGISSSHDVGPNFNRNLLTWPWVYTCSVCRLFIHPTCARVQHHILPPTATAAGHYSTGRFRRNVVNRAAASLGSIATWPASLLYGNSMNQQVLAMSSSSNNYMSTPRGGGGAAATTTNNHSLAQALATKLNPISVRDQDALDRVLALLRSPTRRT